jgi:hypothetical protein
MGIITATIGVTAIIGTTINDSVGTATVTVVTITQDASTTNLR